MAAKRKPAKDKRPSAGSSLVRLAPVGAMFLGLPAAEHLAKQGEKRPLKAIGVALEMRGEGASPKAIHAATSKMLTNSPYAGVIFGKDQHPRFEVDDSTAKIRRFAIPAHGSEHLGNVLDHPELYKAMPETQFATVERSRQGRTGIMGGRIELNDSNFGPRVAGQEQLLELAKGPLLHEVQHDVQDQTPGWAQGGAPDDFRDKYPGESDGAKHLRKQAYSLLPGEQEAELTRERRSYSAKDRRKIFPKYADDIEHQRFAPKTSNRSELFDTRGLVDAAKAAWASLKSRDMADQKPVRFAKLNPLDIGTDSNAFQFKSGGDRHGVTTRMLGVTKWDPVAAGKAVVFERMNGEKVIADGHQRLGLAKRLAGEGQSGIAMDAYVMRERDGWSERDVRAYAALKNMKELSGSALDMAKVARERPDMIDGSLPLSDAKIREAMNLAKLSDPAFKMVVGGAIKPEHAATVGEQVADSTRHEGILAEMAKADIASAQHARLYVGQVMAAPTVTEEHASLFGTETNTRSLLRERAAVLDKAMTALKTDKRIFSLLEREAGAIEGAGNKLAHAENAARAQGAGTTAALIEKLAQTKGQVSDMLDAAARAVAEGKTPAMAARSFVKGVGDTLKKGGMAALTDHRAMADKFELDKPGRYDVKVGAARIQYRVLDDKTVALLHLDVPKAKRGSGAARAAMTDIVNEIDAKGLRATLDVAPGDKSTSAKRLEKFYGELGFKPFDSGSPVMGKGRNATRMRTSMSEGNTIIEGVSAKSREMERAPKGKFRAYDESQVANHSDWHHPPRQPMSDAAKVRAERILAGVPVDQAEAKRIAKAAGEAMSKKPFRAMADDGDMFGGPSTKDKIEAASRAKAAKGRTGDPMNEGLFGSSMKQTDLVEQAKRTAAVEKARANGALPPAPSIKEPKPKKGGKPVIGDIGEKIGGARKDLSGGIGSKGPRAPKAVSTDARPAWARRYDVQEIVGGHNKGMFSLVDNRQTDWKGQPRQIKDFASRAAAEQAIPLMAVSRNHTVRQNQAGQYEIWRKVTDRKNVMVTPEAFPTREAAMQHMAQNAQKIIETKTSYREEILARPERVLRSGPDVRKSAIKGQEFVKTIGFRGVEFGNWNNQAERQSLMNHAYDAMHDLARATGIAPKSVALENKLGLAFGARGHGLQGAAAHYERDYTAINLTKMKGAGHLAHEWWHAMDHYLGRKDDPKLAEVKVNRRGDKVVSAAGVNEDYASHRVVNSYAKGQLAEQVRVAYKDLVDTMYHKEEKFTEDRAAVDKFAAGTEGQIKERLAEIRKNLAEPYPYGKRFTAPATPAQLAKFDEIAGKIVSGQDIAVAWKSKPVGNHPRGRMGLQGRYSNDSLEGISAIYKQVRGRSGFDGTHQRGPLDNVRYAMQRHGQRLNMVADAAAQTVKTKKVPTEFAMNAKRIDQGSVTDYWTTKHEMAARAFSSYIEDKLKSAEHRSDFLSYGSDNKFYKIFQIKPFPEGNEREAINTKFDRLFHALKEAKLVAAAEPTAENVGKAMAVAKADAEANHLRGTQNAANREAIAANKTAKADLVVGGKRGNWHVADATTGEQVKGGFRTKGNALSFLKEKVSGKLGAFAMIAAPLTAAAVAYDAAASKASAEGGKSVSTSPVKAAAIAGVASGAVVAGASVGMAAAGKIAAKAGSKFLSRLVPGIGEGLMAVGAVQGAKKHGLAGAAFGALGADDLLDLPMTPKQKAAAMNPMVDTFNEALGQPKWGKGSDFAAANATYKAMQDTSSNTLKGTQNPKNQAAIIANRKAKALTAVQ